MAYLIISVVLLALIELNDRREFKLLELKEVEYQKNEYRKALLCRKVMAFHNISAAEAVWYINTDSRYEHIHVHIGHCM